MSWVGGAAGATIADVQDYYLSYVPTPGNFIVVSVAFTGSTASPHPTTLVLQVEDNFGNQLTPNPSNPSNQILSGVAQFYGIAASGVTYYAAITNFIPPNCALAVAIDEYANISGIGVTGTNPNPFNGLQLDATPATISLVSTTLVSIIVAAFNPQDAADYGVITPNTGILRQQAASVAGPAVGQATIVAVENSKFYAGSTVTCSANMSGVFPNFTGIAMELLVNKSLWPYPSLIPSGRGC